MQLPLKLTSLPCAISVLSSEDTESFEMSLKGAREWRVAWCWFFGKEECNHVYDLSISYKIIMQFYIRVLMVRQKNRQSDLTTIFSFNQSTSVLGMGPS